jgi:aryl-alcohol dehydrogenase-like predicted oxidoreductase
MDRVTLKHIGLSVPRISIGTMTIGGQTNEDEARRMIDTCLDAGIDFIDTANMYHVGKSEEVLGRILKGRRSKVILASKVRMKMGEEPDLSGLSRAAILRAIDDTLRRLDTDYLDLYYMHAPDWAVPIEETLETMNQLVKQGKVRFLANSNYAGWQVVEMLTISEKHGYQAPVISQPMYNLIARGIEQEYLPMCKRFGVSTIVYNPLAGGLLTGKHQRQSPLPGTRFDNNKLYLDRYWHDVDFDAVEELRAIAAKAGRSIVSLALNWIYHHTAADCIILGASRTDQLNENLKALEGGALDSDTLQACDQVWQKLRGPVPVYNR